MILLANFGFEKDMIFSKSFEAILRSKKYSDQLLIKTDFFFKKKANVYWLTVNFVTFCNGGSAKSIQIHRIIRG